jgi:hypothetical protein
MNHPIRLRLTQFLIASLLFLAIYSPEPLFTSNQNQYFLHGLAHAGYGYLHNDWLANTLDPTPVFSFLIQLTYAATRTTSIFYLLQAFLLGIYLYSLSAILRLLFNLPQDWRTQLSLFAALALLHSVGLRAALARIFGAEATYLLEGGVADQRILGMVLQPSLFGVFLVLSIALFLHRKRILAMLALATAIYFHATYLIAAALVTLGYLWILWRETRTLRAPFFYGASILLAISPMLAYIYNLFKPTGPRTYAEAQNLLVNFRIPHHAVIGEWFNWTVIAQLLIVILALILIWRTQLFPILAFAFGGALTLTLAQAALNNNSLALLFPWRTSTLLVPLSSSLLLAYLLSRAPLSAKFAPIASLVLIGALTVAGVIRYQGELSARQNAPEAALMQFVATHKSEQDVYLTPLKMQDFRLETGAPVFIDFKSIPYRDADVLIWHQRHKLANSFYQINSQADRCALAQRFLAEENVSHIVAPVQINLRGCGSLSELYQDDHYALYFIKNED